LRGEGAGEGDMFPFISHPHLYPPPSKGEEVKRGAPQGEYPLQQLPLPQAERVWVRDSISSPSSSPSPPRGEGIKVISLYILTF